MTYLDISIFPDWGPGPGRGVVISGCRFCDSSSRGMLDGMIDPSRFELESALGSMGAVGMGPKL